MRRRPSSKWLRKARKHLRAGGVIAYPTEYCYGLGCLPSHEQGLKKILRLKARPQHKGMIVVGCSLEALSKLVIMESEERGYIKQIWPAQVSFVLPARAKVLPLLRGRKRSSLAVRVPDLSIVRDLSKDLYNNLVSTSANKSGQMPIKNFRQMQYFKQQGVLVYKERVGGAEQASKIIDLKSGAIVRGPTLRGKR
jgi:L-threonylcarbamoyladenylate synthase